ncbi:adenosylcobinamide amidohydrolase [Halovenus sp. WSH3]|uniref:Adenosylcobinamide amidohydrolase n=1 Tax=Halovenus carboxidivorans TaxID=2692199 RepID=A0A6B0SWU3_9EURY|nr:adenosylcobinamide amidohydrolase [Halovenus carboxidivorans]
MYEPAVTEGVFRLRRPGARWLSTGYSGGFERAPAAYNITVPEGWEREDIDRYSREKREAAGFRESGPTLLTGVDVNHARGARLGPVVAYATVGLSNPATLPADPKETHEGNISEAGPGSVGTVNLIVATDRSLTDGAQANLVSVVAEAKTATLLDVAGVTGTTTDAIVVGSAVDGEEAEFSGSATEVGAAARACVREAIRAGFEARYAEDEPPETVEAARYGVVTDQRADVFDPREHS